MMQCGAFFLKENHDIVHVCFFFRIKMRMIAYLIDLTEAPAMMNVGGD